MISATDIVTIRRATVTDVPLILNFVKELAEYEKLLSEVVATEAMLRETLFCVNPHAEVVIAYLHDQPAGFALYFYNYSTFLGKPGIYLEDLFVKPIARGKGLGMKLFTYLAELAKSKNCGRLEWRVLDWNETAIGFYQSMGAEPVAGWTLYRLTGDSLDNFANR